MLPSILVSSQSNPRDPWSAAVHTTHVKHNIPMAKIGDPSTKIPAPSNIILHIKSLLSCTIPQFLCMLQLFPLFFPINIWFFKTMDWLYNLSTTKWQQRVILFMQSFLAFLWWLSGPMWPWCNLWLSCFWIAGVWERGLALGISEEVVKQDDKKKWPRTPWEHQPLPRNVSSDRLQKYKCWILLFTCLKTKMS